MGGRRLVATLGLGVLLACRTADPPSQWASKRQASAVNSAESQCRQPIEKACNRDKCPTWEEAKAELKASTKQGSRCSVADAGRCGEYLYVRVEDSWGSRISYFDRTGRLVGVKRTQDAMFEPCFGTFRYGKEIGCSPVVRENYCRQ